MNSEQEMRRDMEPTWWNQLREAAILYRKDPKEVLRHAKVSTDNRHRCQSCFTCACVQVYRNHGGMHSPDYSIKKGV